MLLCIPVFFTATNVSAASITLTIPKTLSLTVNPTANNGFAKSDPGKISVSTDNSVGYTLGIKAKNESNDLINGSSKIVSISNNLSEDNFKSSSQSNIWGFMPSKLYNTQEDTSSDNTNFLPGPKSTEDTIIDKTSSPNTDANNYNITLGAKVDNTLPAGSYSNTFIISATANVIPYDAIIQDWDGCEALGSEQVLRLLDTRDNNIYTVSKLKDGKCWMTQNLKIGSNDSTTPLSPEDTDISESYTLPQGSTTGFSDNAAQNIYITPSPDDKNYGGYYTWPAATASTNPSSGEVSHSICPKGWRLPTKTEFDTIVNNYTLTTVQQSPASFVLAGDYNNSSLYSSGTVGIWWSSTASSSTYVYYLALSPLPSYFYTGTSTKWYGHSVRCVSRSTDPKVMQNVDQWAGKIERGQSTTAVDERDGKSYTVARLNDDKLWMTQNLALGDDSLANRTLTPNDSDISSNYTLPANSMSGFSDYKDQNIYVDSTWGGYYTWAATTAGTNPSSGETSNSICPKGWRLPTGGAAGEFQILAKAYGGTGDNETGNTTLRDALVAAPAPHFAYSGDLSSNSIYDQGVSGYWWSSTAKSGNYAQLLVVHSIGNINPLGESRKKQGFSIRCISHTDDPTMQTVEKWGHNVPQGKIIEKVKDTRDGNTYSVARLKDNKLWMIENLRIENKELTPNDSDVSGNFSLPPSIDSGFNTTESANVHIDSIYGGYYNWYAATAGIDPDSGDTSSSICPKGWKLPTSGNTSSDFSALVIAYGGTGNSQTNTTVRNTLIATPIPGFVYSGHFYNNSIDGTGSRGDYWSSTARDSSGAYHFSFYSNGNIHPLGNYSGKVFGYSIRCMAR